MVNPVSNLVHSGFLLAADKTPDKMALVSDEARYTFAELLARAQNFAGAVTARLGPDVIQPRIAMAVQNSPAVIDVFFGTLMAGGHICLCDPAWPESLLRRILADHKPHLLICEDNIAAQQSDAGDHCGVISQSDLRAFLNLAESSPALPNNVRPDAPFLLGFTSGSSGHPKGFIRNHLTWIESFRHSAVEFQTGVEDCVLAPGPLSHGLSLYAVIEALSMGATAVIQPRFDASAVSSLLSDESVSTLVMVPTMLDVFLEHAKAEAFPNVRAIVTAGAKLSPNLRVRANAVCPNADIIEYYGASELSFATIAKGSEECPAASVGRAFSGVEIEIRDPSGLKVSAGQVGTVWLRSTMICTGYVGPSDGSGLRAEGAWATVGDLGHCDENGYLFLDGREGAAITSAGYTVYPSAIEAVLLSHESVVDAVVIGVPHPRWGEVIAAAVVPASECDLSQDDLQRHCQAALEPYACPRQWVITDQLARTASGKIKRDILAGLFAPI